MKKTLSILFTAILLFSACKTSDQREKLLQKITQAEQELFSNNLDPTLEKKQQLMDLYILFANDFPQDSLTPDLLFRCANTAINSQQEKYAITLYQRIYDEFPDHALRPVALLNQALVYDNMGDAEHAKPLYEQFLVMFPDNPYAADVQQLLKMVGKSPEEWELLMQEFENQEKTE